MAFNISKNKREFGKGVITSLFVSTFITALSLISFTHYERHEEQLENSNLRIQKELITIGKIAELEGERQAFITKAIAERKSDQVAKIESIGERIGFAIRNLRYNSLMGVSSPESIFLRTENKHLFDEQKEIQKLIAEKKFDLARKQVNGTAYFRTHRNFQTAIDTYRDQLEREVLRLQRSFSRYQLIQRILGIMAFSSWIGILFYLYVVVSASNRLLNGTVNRMEYILDGAGLGSWDWWLETNRVNFDKRWLEMIGLKEGEVPMALSTWDSRVHPDDKAKCYADIKDYLEGKTTVYENIHRMRHANGNWVWILDRGRISERDENGKAIRFTGTHFDITNYKNAEFISEEIQALANIGGWELDVEEQKLTWTDQTYRIHGIAPGSPIEVNKAIDFYAPHERSKISNCVADCFSGKSYRDIFEFYDAQGGKKWVEANGLPIFNSAGKVVALRGTFQDVSERVEAAHRLDRLIKNSPGAICQFKEAVNGTRSFPFLSEKCFELFEVNPSVVQISPLFIIEMIEQEFLSEVDRLIQESKEKLSDFQWEGRIKTGKGNSRWIAVRSSPKLQPDGAVVWDGLILDITEKKMLEASLDVERGKAIMSARLASLGEMSAGIAHEINNPLALIAGTLALLPKLMGDPEKVSTKIQIVKKATDRIAKIIKGLKKFSRTSEIREFQWHSMDEIVSEAIQMVDFKITRGDISLVTEVCLSCKIFCDQVEVEQVLTNLINNAIDAVSQCEERWIRIQAADDGAQLILRVIDSGPGISPELEKKIFDPFFTTKPVGLGTGLGLSITKGILEQHKAKIFINRNFQNTCFEMHFPKPVATDKVA